MWYYYMYNGSFLDHSLVAFQPWAGVTGDHSHR